MNIHGVRSYGDVFSGRSLVHQSLASFSINVTGIDPSDELIAIAKEHVRQDSELARRVTYEIDTIEDHAKRNPKKYDAVVLSEVIEHVNEQEAFLKLCIDVVKPGGSIFLSTFNKTIISYIWGIFLMEDIFKVLPKDTHQWKKFISHEETQRIFEKYNCQVVKVNGLLYQHWNNDWKWTKSTGVTYLQHAIKNE
ncbi:ubiquinone biosynthesis O-methyltransferase, mitochondrial-like [Lutzomyia longipalpis]|uniref:ubiquinone biosynthesis O-methyltransferase, mitochondrial-like n=1 Tax=Lutzomyia longipalpis TaxID=7200 RepID=UPI00248336C9|nr:ubiquinone biosynthesis O-methyltransferase, mitochondrial-like [Lutzomyia longipalpis]